VLALFEWAAKTVPAPEEVARAMLSASALGMARQRVKNQGFVAGHLDSIHPCFSFFP
jgi:hypothetical protein